MSTAWTSRYAQRTKNVRSSTIRELLKDHPEPGNHLVRRRLARARRFPGRALPQACTKVLDKERELALQYGASEGYEPLREMIARHTSRYGVKAKPENVLITSGSQQALDLIGKLLINSGDRVLVEAPTYPRGPPSLQCLWRGVRLCAERQRRDCVRICWKSHSAPAQSCTCCPTSKTRRHYAGRRPPP